jgi:hypothetical protein
METVMRHLPTALATALGLAACAPDPATVAPSWISPTAYSGLSCDALNLEAARLSQRLAQVTGEQQAAAEADAVNTAISLILFWPAIFWIGTDDRSDELARVRGEAEALRLAALQGGC